MGLSAGAFWDQSPFDTRLEWGLDGVSRLAPLSDVVVIVDVLSFSTAVDVAVGRGALVYPHVYRDETAREAAERLGAILAGRPGGGGPSLSPASLRQLEPGARLVLPSPNGSTLTVTAAEARASVFAGCLRNASAVAAAARAAGRRVTVIAAGEQWRYDAPALRPSVEDLLGAGAIVDALGSSNASPEAAAALAAFRAARGRLPDTLRACSSGRELIERGQALDVELASELDASSAVPQLIDGAYRDVA